MRTYILSVYVIVIAVTLALLPQLMITNVWPYAAAIILLGLLGTAKIQLNKTQKGLHHIITTQTLSHKALLVALGYSLCICFLASVCVTFWRLS
jgi:hypothetical protein